MLTEEEKDLLLRNIWNGRINDRTLPKNLYVDTGNGLRLGWMEGFGTIEAPAFDVAAQLNRNIYTFSGAKTFQQVKDMSNFIVDAEGFIRPFRDFKASVDPIYSQYNEQWLRTEFDTAKAQARSAAKWQDIQADKEILPLLRYQTALDSLVRPEHADWVGLVFPVDHPFWSSNMPPNGFNCRCGTIQLEADEAPISTMTNVTPNTDKLFSMNPGTDELIFKETGNGRHPYFDVSRKDVSFKNKNFGPPLPEGTDPL